MRILYDHQIFETQRFGGISRYFYELWRHADAAGFSAKIEIRYGKNIALLEAEEFRTTLQPFDDPWNVFLENANIPGKKRLLQIKQRLAPRKNWKRTLNMRNRHAVLKQLTQRAYDIFHPTYYDSYFLDTLKGTPFVLTVFDMIHERFPEYFKLADLVSMHKQQLCQAATRVLAISEQTKRDLIAIFGIDPEKIEVVYLASSFSPCHAASEVELPATYLLFTGSRAIYKNFYFLLRAISNILREQNIALVCSGEHFSANELRFFESLGVLEHVIHIPADDAMLAHLYQHALAFVFPSLYEGFGIPALEAFACGCPALLSNASSLPEVGGEAAIYFEPKDMRSIQEAVATVIFHEDVRQQLIAKGQKRLKQFSWEATAQKTCAAYNNALNKS